VLRRASVRGPIGTFERGCLLPLSVRFAADAPADAPTDLCVHGPAGLAEAVAMTP
jgi:hypothetical protein